MKQHQEQQTGKIAKFEFFWSDKFTPTSLKHNLIIISKKNLNNEKVRLYWIAIRLKIY